MKDVNWRQQTAEVRLHWSHSYGRYAPAQILKDTLQQILKDTLPQILNEKWNYFLLTCFGGKIFTISCSTISLGDVSRTMFEILFQYSPSQLGPTKVILGMYLSWLVNFFVKLPKNCHFKAWIIVRHPISIPLISKSSPSQLNQSEVQVRRANSDQWKDLPLILDSATTSSLIDWWTLSLWRPFYEIPNREEVEKVI